MLLGNIHNQILCAVPRLPRNTNSAQTISLTYPFPLHSCLVIVPGGWTLTVCLDLLPYHTRTKDKTAHAPAGSRQVLKLDLEVASRRALHLRQEVTAFKSGGLGSSTVVGPAPWQAWEMHELAVLLGTHAALVIRLIHMWSRLTTISQGQPCR